MGLNSNGFNENFHGNLGCVIEATAVELVAVDMKQLSYLEHQTDAKIGWAFW